MKAIITIRPYPPPQNSGGKLCPPPLRTAAHLPRFTVTGTTMRLHAADWQYWLDDRPRILRLGWLTYPQLRRTPGLMRARRPAPPASTGCWCPFPGTSCAGARVLDLDGSTAARRDVSRLLAIIADADLGLVPVTDAGQLPAWLRGTSSEHPHLADRWHQEAADDWHEAVVQTVAAIVPDATLLWALTEPPGPDRAAARCGHRVSIVARRALRRPASTSPASGSARWSRSGAWPPRERAPCRPSSGIGGASTYRSARKRSAGWRSRSASTCRRSARHCSSPTLGRRWLAPCSCKRLLTMSAWPPDLLATVAAGEPSTVAQLNALALDEWRPPTVWQQPTITGSPNEPAGPSEDRALWRQSIAALARGSQSLGWSAAAAAPGSQDTPAPGGWPAVAQVARLLDRSEALLVRSTPVYDPLVLLWDGLSELTTEPDEALAASSGGQLLALLGTAGWQPECLDLSTLDDETLGEFRAAIIIGYGSLELEAYGRLVVYAVGGGHLLTVGRPIHADESGRRINTRVLYPRPTAPPAQHSAGIRSLRQRLRTLFRGQPLSRFGTESSNVPLAGEPLTFAVGPGDDLWWQWHGSRRGPPVAYRGGGTPRQHNGRRRSAPASVGGGPQRTARPCGGSSATCWSRWSPVGWFPSHNSRSTCRYAKWKRARRCSSPAIPALPSAELSGCARSPPSDSAGTLRAEVIAAAGESTAHVGDDGATLSVIVDAGDALVVRLH